MKMEKEEIQSVLTELLEEQKENTRLLIKINDLLKSQAD